MASLPGAVRDRWEKLLISTCISIGATSFWIGALYDHLWSKSRPPLRLFFALHMVVFATQVVVFLPQSDRKVPHIQKLVAPILIQVKMNGFSHWSRLLQANWPYKKCRAKIAVGWVISYFLKFANNFEEQGHHHFFSNIHR